MHDPILEELWRVRAELVKKYGGFDGLLKEVQKIERAHSARRKKQSEKKKPPTLDDSKTNGGNKRETVSADPILDEIHRVREELLKKHGGFDGYLKYIQKLDRAHRARLRKKRKKAGRKRASAAR